MRSSYGVARVDQPLTSERPLLADAQTLMVEEIAGEVTSSEEDDAFQWFVNLFVAEYSSEA